MQNSNSYGVGMGNLNLFDVFTSRTSQELDRLMGRNCTLHADHFMMVANAAHARSIGPLECESICRLLKADWDIGEALNRLHTGELKGKKIAKLAGQLERHNRAHLHMFFASEQNLWWAFHFTLHDLGTTERDIHWERPHIHLTTYLKHPLRTRNWLLDEIRQNDKPEIAHDYHIPFVGDIGQEKRFGF
jgi:hypothetical protein